MPDHNSVVIKSGHSIDRPVVSSYQVFNFVANIFAIILLLALFVVFETVLYPFSRGFFCDDETIAKPYKKETISAALLGVLSFIFILIVIVICDILNKCYPGKVRYFGQENPMARRCCFKPWIYKMFARIVFALVGFGLCMVFIDVFKVMVGRLRPHFLSVCKPTFTQCTPGVFYDLTNCSSSADQKALREARKSFPSGHAGASAYSSVFFALYVEYSVRPRILSLVKPLVQLLALLGGIAISLTRISDYFHHWSDVLAGFLIGTALAFYTIHRLLELPKDFPERSFSHKKEDGIGTDGLPMTIITMDVEQNLERDSSTSAFT